MADESTLCWKCRVPGTGRCSWDASKGVVPVEGWTAEPTTVTIQGKGPVRSYRVIDCPLKELETPTEAKRRRTALTNDQLRRWMQLGFSDEHISKRCGLSRNTVAQRRQKLMREDKEHGKQ